MSARCLAVALLLAGPVAAIRSRFGDRPLDVYKLRASVLKSQSVQDKISKTCKGQNQDCQSRAGDAIFCELLARKHPDLAAQHCGTHAVAKATETAVPVQPKLVVQPAAQGKDFASLKEKLTSGPEFQKSVTGLASAMGCGFVKKSEACANYVREAAFCLSFAEKMSLFAGMQGEKEEETYCANIDQKLPALSMMQQRTRPIFLEQQVRAPEDDLAREMTHDLEMNFNKIAPFGKEDTAKELQDHAAKTQDTLVDAVENAEVAEIKRAVFRALTRLRAATIKEFDTIARLETQAIDAYNDAHHYRAENPLAHLHEDEAPVETDKLKSFH
mmetsp:Transcript_47622/g.92097  ORF Transcript_47622/g.92097 Transcript_47622/m.92097 type:complete len:329 (+) Transcript_47622:108-1094(+)